MPNVIADLQTIEGDAEPNTAVQKLVEDNQKMESSDTYASVDGSDKPTVDSSEVASRVHKKLSYSRCPECICCQTCASTLHTSTSVGFHLQLWVPPSSVNRFVDPLAARSGCWALSCDQTTKRQLRLNLVTVCDSTKCMSSTACTGLGEGTGLGEANILSLAC